MRHALLALALLVTASARAEDAPETRYEVPDDVRSALDKRKAELTSLKIGVGMFRHLYSVKPTDIGLTLYIPKGDPLVFDALAKYPKEMQGAVSDNVLNLFRTKEEPGSWEFPGEHKDYHVEAAVQWRSGAQDYGFGFLLSRAGKDDFYKFMISNTKGAVFTKTINGQTVILQKWADYEAVKPNVENILRVEREGDAFRCYSNGTLLFTVKDAKVEKGTISAFISNKMSVTFKNFTIQDVAIDENTRPMGSGLDYAESVVKGMAASGLFLPTQLGISNFPPNEDWDYVVGADAVTKAGPEGVSFHIKSGRDGKKILEKSLPLPGAWDGKQGSSGGSGEGESEGGWSDTPRDRAMQKLGRYLAYKVAQQALGL
ncbi:MAG: hypothetical protein HY078_03405 [Elusimicrobia bacterium]|nr:hypothetical protein [Elusimicrobiota bacterium]